MQSAFSRFLAFGSESTGHGDAELSVIQRELSKGLIGIGGERDQRVSNEGVRGKVNDGDVARAFVRNRNLGSEFDLFSGSELLDVVLVVFELDTFTQEDVAVGRTVASYVLEGSSYVRGEGRDGLGSTDLLRDCTCLANRRRDDVAVRKGGGGEKGRREEC